MTEDIDIKTINHWANIALYSLKVVDPNEDYRDICYLGYVEALQSFKPMPGGLSFRNWTIRCMKHKVIGELQRKEARKRPIEAYLSYEETATIGFISNEFAAIENMDLCNKVLKCLNQRERDVFVLTNYYGMECPEIMDKLGITEASVYHSRRQAKRKIKYELKRKGISVGYSRYKKEEV